MTLATDKAYADTLAEDTVKRVVSVEVAGEAHFDRLRGSTIGALSVVVAAVDQIFPHSGWTGSVVVS